MSQAKPSNLPDYQTRIIARSCASDSDISFDTAEHTRHKARLSGMNPNYWYPAEWSKKVKSGKHCETHFWSQSIALFRDENGEIAALENRCPHRHLPLTMGSVKGCTLVCIYHGWAFDKAGELQSVSHDQFERQLPKTSIQSFPVKERYGLIWIFPGDPDLAEQTPLPLIPDAEGKTPWAGLGFDFTWKAHHSMVMDNLCNLTHLYVHGEWVPYDKTWMSHSDLSNESIKLVWLHTMREKMMWPIYKLFFLLPGEKNLTDTHDLYDYPYHVALQNKRIRTVNLMLPEDRDRTRVFTIQYWKAFNFPLIPKIFHFSLMNKVIVPMIRPITKEVFRQDGATVQAEMDRLDENFFKPIPEINHTVRLFDKLNVERWQAWLDYLKGKHKHEESLREKVLLAEPITYKSNQ